QRLCNHLGPGAVHTFFWRWFHRLPSPFTTEDLQAGYAYELAFRQFEVSDTRVFDQPQAGRASSRALSVTTSTSAVRTRWPLFLTASSRAVHPVGSGPRSSRVVSIHSCPAPTSHAG